MTIGYQTNQRTERPKVLVLGLCTLALLATVYYPLPWLVSEHGFWEWIQVVILFAALVVGVRKAIPLGIRGLPLWMLLLGIAFALGEEVQWGAQLYLKPDAVTKFSVHELEIGGVDLNRAAGWTLFLFNAVFLVVIPLFALVKPEIRRWASVYGWPIPSWYLVPFSGFAMVVSVVGLTAAGWSASEIHETLVYLVLCFSL